MKKQTKEELKEFASSMVWIIIMFAFMLWYIATNVAPQEREKRDDTKSYKEVVLHENDTDKAQPIP